MSWTTICHLNDIVPHTGVGALVAGRQLAVFRLDDEAVFAIDNFDPNSGANVLSRGIVGCLDGQICVASPIYKQHFRLSDGLCLEDAGKSVQAHAVRIQDGMIEIQLNRTALNRAA